MMAVADGVTGLTHHRILGIVVLLIAVNPALTGYSWSHPGREAKLYGDHTMKILPEFEDMSPEDISVMLGQTAFLPCRVRHLGDKLVSWIRTKDLHIMTSGPHTFTADDRISVVDKPEDDMWTLRITSSKPKDTGRYECQINTDPKMSKFFNLTVRETPLKDSPSPTEVISAALKASISGPKEQYVKVGSVVTFECRVALEREKYLHRFSRVPLPSIQWVHNDLAVNFQAERGGISIETDRGDKAASSRLTVAIVRFDDAGRYSCTGKGVAPDTVYLHVIESEYFEPMQRDQASGVSGFREPCQKIPCIFTQILFTVMVCTLASYDWIWNMRRRFDFSPGAKSPGAKAPRTKAPRAKAPRALKAQTPGP
ncbi:fasciclin-2-like [Arctopsyche grandis]|uniref:fasciclin-2-like n=1 Tax=Arctopsyche grandis TaxID=121162 RepID=UPI00406D9824